MFNWLFGKKTTKAVAKANGHVDVWDELAKTHHTPDVAELSIYETQLLFVYDNLMKNRFEHFLIEGAPEMGTAYTKDKLSMWVKKGAMMSYPIIFKDDKSALAPPSHIRGKIYKVNTKNLLSLDNDRRNGVCFTRQRMPLLMPVRYVIEGKQEKYHEDWQTKVDTDVTGLSEVYHKEVMAWVYLYHPQEDKMSAHNGWFPVRPLDSRNPVLGRYYWFKD